MFSLDYTLVDVVTTKIHVTHIRSWARWPPEVPSYSEILFIYGIPGIQASMLNCKNTEKKSNKKFLIIMLRTTVPYKWQVLYKF